MRLAGRRYIRRLGAGKYGNRVFQIRKAFGASKALESVIKLRKGLHAYEQVLQGRKSSKGESLSCDFILAITCFCTSIRLLNTRRSGKNPEILPARRRPQAGSARKGLCAASPAGTLAHAERTGNRQGLFSRPKQAYPAEVCVQTYREETRLLLASYAALRTLRTPFFTAMAVRRCTPFYTSHMGRSHRFG